MYRPLKICSTKQPHPSGHPAIHCEIMTYKHQELKCVHLLGRPVLLSSRNVVRKRFGGQGINFIWNLISFAFP